MLPNWIIQDIVEEGLPIDPLLAAQALAGKLEEVGFRAEIRGRISEVDLIIDRKDDPHPPILIQICRSRPISRQVDTGNTCALRVLYRVVLGVESEKIS